MKKLALALVCLVSVAFFASCDPTTDTPEPTITVLAGADCVNGTVENPQIISNQDETNWRFGFHVESNAVTKVALASLKITYDYVVDGETSQWSDEIDLTGLTTYDYVDYVWAQDDEKMIILENTVRATVTDADGKVSTASLAYKIDAADEPLEAQGFEWKRIGSHDGTGLEMFGLKWTQNNSKEDFAYIEPVDGARLYQFQPEVWDETTTMFGKAELFAEMPVSISLFKGVSAWTSHDYDFVIGTLYEDEYYLIHITRGDVSFSGGTNVTITGEWK
jgi:hypothetical protein